MKRLILLSLIMCSALSGFSQTWRSALYPEDWFPGYKDNVGRFLHDFSFAGYHAGEKDIPFVNENVLDVTQAPFNADSTGSVDVTSVLQLALDSVGKNGGGVVYLPKGTYRIVTTGNAGLWIKYSNVVLRGAGKDKTFIFNDQPSMRFKNIILVKPQSGGDWYAPEAAYDKLARDVQNQDSIVEVAGVSKYKIGDWIVVTSNVTNEFIAEHKMTGLWNTTLPGLAFYRIVKAIDAEKNTILLDAPVRYTLKTRDNARVYLLNKHIEEVGIENLAIGNRQNDLTGWGDLDYKTAGTGAYDVDNAIAVNINCAVNCWMRNVSTYKPAVNSLSVHLVSHGVLLEKSRFITLDSCYFGYSQYEGENGNGYMYTLRGNECLIKNSVGDNGRHNFDFKSMMTSGNVILRCRGKNSRMASDFHMHLSPANLFDNHIVDNDVLEAAYRPYGTIQHGQTTSQSVFWNTYGIKSISGSVIIKTQQWGYGYVIGTQGAVTGVSAIGGNNTEPVDFVEGVAKGTTLEPASLYEDQLRKRKAGYIYKPTKLSEKSESGVLIFPNPASDKLIIKTSYQIDHLEIINIAGKSVYFKKGDVRNISVASLQAGYYTIKMNFRNLSSPFVSSFVKL